MSITIKRKEAFETVFKTKAPAIPLYTRFTHNSEEAFTFTKEQLQLKKKPDTIFCMSDEILTGTMKAIQELQLKTGKDIAVIAMSNGYIPKLYSPEITYVETSGFKLGKLAFSRMISCMSGSTFMQELTQECNLVQGQSL